MPKKEKKQKQSSLEFVKEALTLIGGLAGSILAVYGLVKTFKEDVAGFSWLIPVGVIIWIIILWRLFQVRKTTAYSLLIISILIGVIGWIGWQSQVKATEDKIVIFVAQFDGPEETYGLRNQIMEELHKAAKEDSNILIVDGKEVVTSGQGSDYARKLGEAESADLVIWAWYKPTDNPNITIHFENLSPTQIETIKNSETYQPQATIEDLKSFEIQQKIGTETKTLIAFIGGMANYQSGNYQEVVNRFEAILIEPNISTYINPAELNFYIAYSYYELGSYQLSIQSYDQSIGLDPSHDVTYNNRGVAYHYLKDYDQAIRDYSQAIQLNPNYAVAYNNRGNAYDNLKDYNQAIQDYNQAIQLDPNYVSAYRNRGLAYSNLQDYNQAVQDYSQAIKLDPNYAAAYNSRGNAYYDLNDYDQATQDYTQAIQLDSSYAIAYYNRGNVYYDLKDYNQAIEDYSLAIQFDPNYAAAYNNRGDTYTNLQDYDLAIQDYSQAIQLAPSFDDAYYNRGNAYYDLLDYDNAIKDYEKAIQLKPNEYPEYYYNRGLAYHSLKDYDRAIQDYDKALKMAPNLANAYYARGLAYKALGKTSEAEADFAKYKELTGQDAP